VGCGNKGEMFIQKERNKKRGKERTKKKAGLELIQRRCYKEQLAVLIHGGGPAM
jgi:hypothetical protein